MGERGGKGGRERGKNPASASRYQRCCGYGIEVDVLSLFRKFVDTFIHASCIDMSTRMLHDERDIDAFLGSTYIYSWNSAREKLFKDF